MGGGQICGRLRRDSWTLLCPAKQFLHFRLSRDNLYIAKRNQFAGKYLWSFRRCFGHCPWLHSSSQRHTADKRGGHGNEGAPCNAGALSLRILREARAVGALRRRGPGCMAAAQGRLPNIRWMERTIAGPLSRGKKSATVCGL